MNFTPTTFPLFNFYCQKVLPLVYDESLSYLEVLCKMRDYLNKMATTVNEYGDNMEEWHTQLNELSDESAKMSEAIALLQEEIRKIENGEYSEMYVDSMEKWVNDNMPDIVAKFVRFIGFGLTTDGYFCAYIPTNWQFLQFSSVRDLRSPLYGHLILNW